MNVILILNKELKRFEVITNIPDEIIEDAEKVEEFLQENGYDLNRIEWISDDITIKKYNPLELVKAYLYEPYGIRRVY